MSGDINMGGHEVIGLDDPSVDSSRLTKNTWMTRSLR